MAIAKHIHHFQNPFLIFFFLLITTVTSADETFPFVAQATGDGVNIRAGQSANFEKVGQLKAGQPVVVIEKSFSWYKIKLPVDAKSYISAKYVNALDDKTGQVTTDRVNIRAGNGEQASILGQAAQGQYVRILEKLEGWYRIEPIEESFGWVNKDYLKYASRELPPKRVVEAPIRNVYAKKRMTESLASAETPASASSSTKAEDLKAVFMTGVVEGLADQPVAKDIHHIVTDENNASYYLKGPQEIIDVFLHRKVSVEGSLGSEITAPHPVVLIKKINLIL